MLKWKTTILKERKKERKKAGTKRMNREKKEEKKIKKEFNIKKNSRIITKWQRKKEKVEIRFLKMELCDS